jgi:hypothetical protein
MGGIVTDSVLEHLAVAAATAIAAKVRTSLGFKRIPPYS